MSESDKKTSSPIPKPTSSVFIKKPTYDESSSSENTSDDDSDSFETEPTIREQLTDDYQNELDEDLKHIILPPKRKKRKATTSGRAKVSKIPAHLKGLVGEANLRFARGDSALAEKICYELIRQTPHAHEPYLILSQIYETSHPSKSLQYLTMAAHLDLQNADNWLRLANIHIELKNVKTAVTSLTKALTADPRNIETHLKRIELLESLEDHKSVRRCKVRLLSAYSRRDYKIIMTKAKELAETFHAEKEYSKAIEVMSVPFRKCRRHITPEMVNIYLQLLLLTDKHTECLDIFVQHCNVEIELMLDEENTVNIISYQMPSDIQIDLRIKVIICIIKLRGFHLVTQMLAPLLDDESAVETIGDLYFDVAEALISVQRYADALTLLVPLIKSNNYSLAAVWLKYADCHKELSLIDQAIEGYKTVIRLAPMHLDVRHPLAELLLEKGEVAEALEVLTQHKDTYEIDVELLRKKMAILRGLEDFKRYYECVDVLLGRHCIKFLHYEELRSVCFNETHREKLNRIRQQRSFRNETDFGDTESVSVREPDVETEYTILLDILAVCLQRKDYGHMQRYVFMSLGSSKFRTQIDELSIIAFFASMYNKDNFYAYPIIRELVVRNPEHNLIWNLFNLFVQKLDDMRQCRFLMRTGKMLVFSVPRLLEANNALSVGNQKMATAYLMPYLKHCPTPLIYLLLAVALSHGKRTNAVKLLRTAFALGLTYAKTRSKDAQQEIYYNLGRLYHQHGIVHVAANYYRKALAAKNVLSVQHSDLNLEREIAYNLMLIYRESGDSIGARNLIVKHLTI